jgi:carbonic anhydrase
MSIYSSSTTWACPTTDQSPINLSQASSKPCDLLCELVMDDVMIPQANVIVSDEGLIIQSTAGLGSCKYNGEGYTCSMVLVNHPSHHTIENIQADAEAIAVFTNPTGKMLCVSSLVRVNSTQTSSTRFFNAFVGYANPSQQYTPVNLGENWGVNMMVPPNGAYFVYDGSMVAPPCQSVKWVVFKSMINIDPNDFALLTKNVSPGSRPVQPVGDREVFFNDIEHLAGAPMPRDNKTYMRCRRAGSGGPTTGGKEGLGSGGGLLGGGKKTGDVISLDAKAKESENKSKKISGVHKFVKDQIATNGIISLVDLVITIAAVVIGLYYGSKSDYSSTGMILMRKAQEFAAYLRTFFIRPSAPVFTSSS